MLPILDAGIGSDAIPQLDKDFLSHFDPIQLGREHFLDLTRGNGPLVHRILNVHMPGSKKWWRLSSVFLLLQWKSNPGKLCSYFSSNCIYIPDDNKQSSQEKNDWSETKNRPCVKIADQNSLPMVFGGHVEHTSMFSFKKLQPWPPTILHDKTEEIGQWFLARRLAPHEIGFHIFELYNGNGLGHFPSMHISF